jgi:hypothetical protein
MMKVIGVLFLSHAAAVIACGQQFMGVDSADTSRTLRFIIADPGITTGKSTLVLPLSLQTEEASEDISLFNIWKHTSVRPPLLGSPVEAKADLMATLRAQWARDSQLSSLRSVLGTVQFGAVGYLAYRALTSKDNPKPIKKK